MNCPACGTQMTEMVVSDVKIQACKGGCGGLWFDEWMLRKVDQPDQSAGEALLHIEQNPATKVDPEKPRNCPRDTAIVMMRHFWSVKRDVVVDECPKCEGVFLDPGELAAIRSDYKSDAERHTYVALTSPFEPSSRPMPAVNSRVSGDVMPSATRTLAVGKLANVTAV